MSRVSYLPPASRPDGSRLLFSNATSRRSIMSALPDPESLPEGPEIKMCRDGFYETLQFPEVARGLFRGPHVQENRMESVDVLTEYGP